MRHAQLATRRSLPLLSVVLAIAAACDSSRHDVSQRHDPIAREGDFDEATEDDDVALSPGETVSPSPLALAWVGAEEADSLDEAEDRKFRLHISNDGDVDLVPTVRVAFLGPGLASFDLDLDDDVLPAGSSVIVEVDPVELGVELEVSAFSGQVFAEADPGVPGLPQGQAAAFYHVEEDGPLLLYGEDRLLSDFGAGDLMGKFEDVPPEIPDGAVIAGYSSLVLAETSESGIEYAHQLTDAPGPFGEGAASPQLVASGPQASLSYTFCVRWFTAPADNGFGEDYMTSDGDYNARGAWVTTNWTANGSADGGGDGTFLGANGCFSFTVPNGTSIDGSITVSTRAPSVRIVAALS